MRWSSPEHVQTHQRDHLHERYNIQCTYGWTPYNYECSRPPLKLHYTGTYNELFWIPEPHLQLIWQGKLSLAQPLTAWSTITTRGWSYFPVSTWTTAAYQLPYSFKYTTWPYGAAANVSSATAEFSCTNTDEDSSTTGSHARLDLSMLTYTTTAY